MSEVRFERDDRSLGELFQDLARELSTLVRQEINLAKTEMSQKAAGVGKNVGLIAAGGALAYAGLLAVVAALVIMLAAVLPWWAAALLVGLAVIGIGAALAMTGLKALKKTDLAPHETVESIKEDARWVQAQTRQRG